VQLDTLDVRHLPGVVLKHFTAAMSSRAGMSWRPIIGPRRRGRPGSSRPCTSACPFFIEEAKASDLMQRAIERAGLRCIQVAPPGNPFIEEAKASGLVQRAIERAGERGIQVAPPGNPTAQ